MDDGGAGRSGLKGNRAASARDAERNSGVHGGLEGPASFRAPFGLHGGHRQTLAAYWLHGARFPYRAKQHQVQLPDGDRIVLHDDLPSTWRHGDRTALMLHGLAGCHLSPYMVRIAHKLNQIGVRTFRMDLRGAGAGQLLAKRHYHSGRSEDAEAALGYLQSECPGSPVALIGFSLSGNIVLKLAGESAGGLPPNLERAAAVSPPIDLSACCRTLARGFNRMYDRFFVKLLLESIEARRRRLPDLAYVELRPRPGRLIELDDRFTAPLAGFDGAEDYYAKCSANQFLHRIEIPTLIVAAADDPLIPAEVFRRADCSASVRLEMPSTGGHLGFLASNRLVADRRWLDRRLLEWISG